jgi:hypothetical protein
MDQNCTCRHCWKFEARMFVTQATRQISNGDMKHGFLNHIEKFYDNAYKLVPDYVFR